MAFVAAPLALRRNSFTTAPPTTCSHPPATCSHPPHTSPTIRMVQSDIRRTTPDIDWQNLGFQYIQTASHVQTVWSNGQWSPLTTVHQPYIRMHISSTALHYGQSCFEGLKAFRGIDDRVRIFRPDQNAQRMASSAKRLVIPQLPQTMFLEAVHRAVNENIEYIPPYGSGGSLYIRPLLFGSGAKIGLQPSDEFTFLVLVVPVGDYYKGGLSPVTAIVMEDFDRAAPKGVGNVKVAGNYAADLLPNMQGKQAGYPINLYLDAQNRRTIEEFGTSNFFALKGNAYVTPDSMSVLPSITNNTLMQLASDEGMQVQRREVDIDELTEFDEVGACGTAVVITAVTRIVHGSKLYQIGKQPDKVGDRLLNLYNRVRAIQYGEEEDKYGWAQELISS